MKDNKLEALQVAILKTAKVICGTTLVVFGVGLGTALLRDYNRSKEVKKFKHPKHDRK